MESYFAARAFARQADLDALRKKNLEAGQAARDTLHESLAPYLGPDRQAAAQTSADLHPERNMLPGLKNSSR